MRWALLLSLLVVLLLWALIVASGWVSPGDDLDPPRGPVSAPRGDTPILDALALCSSLDEPYRGPAQRYVGAVQELNESFDLLVFEVRDYNEAAKEIQTQRPDLGLEELGAELASLDGLVKTYQRRWSQHVLHVEEHEASVARSEEALEEWRLSNESDDTDPTSSSEVVSRPASTPPAPPTAPTVELPVTLSRRWAVIVRGSSAQFRPKSGAAFVPVDLFKEALRPATQHAMDLRRVVDQLREQIKRRTIRPEDAADALAQRLMFVGLRTLGAGYGAD